MISLSLSAKRREGGEGVGGLFDSIVLLVVLWLDRPLPW